MMIQHDMEELTVNTSGCIKMILRHAAESRVGCNNCQAQFKLAIATAIELSQPYYQFLANHHIASATNPPHSFRNQPTTTNPTNLEKYQQSFISKTLLYNIGQTRLAESKSNQFDQINKFFQFDHINRFDQIHQFNQINQLSK